MNITFFLDCAFISDTNLDRPDSAKEPIEDDFSHFVNSNVQIFPNGSVKVVPKKEDIDTTEEIDEVEAKWLEIDGKKRKKNNKRKGLFKSKRKFKRTKITKNVDQEIENK